MINYNQERKMVMLKYFKVKNYKGFKDEIFLDFSKHRDYSFHQSFIKNGIVNKGIIYGKNGSGKSNFGLAIFDIVCHLTDKFKNNDNVSYQNGYNLTGFVNFEYVFAFGKDEITYKYSKLSPFSIISEELLINNQLVINYNFEDMNVINNLNEARTLKLSSPLRIEQSYVRFVYDHCNFNENHPLCLMMDFVNRMLWFRSVNNNQFVGYKENPEQLTELIDKAPNGVKGLEKFLSGVDKNLDFKLSIEKNLYNQKILMINYNDGNRLPFINVVSTGTLSLCLFYYWSLKSNGISFLYIDDFDAHYYYKTSEYILNYINKIDGFQSFVTTHNTSLLNNDIVRPDCCFIISENKKIKALPECTEKEIREAHNLERMYRNGAFTL